jgi:hypothetical protein
MYFVWFGKILTFFHNVIRLTPIDMRFEVLTAVKMSMLVFWVVTPCELVDRHQRFGGAYCLHLQGWGEFMFRRTRLGVQWTCFRKKQRKLEALLGSLCIQVDFIILKRFSVKKKRIGLHSIKYRFNWDFHFLCETFSLWCKLKETQQNLIHANLKSFRWARISTSGFSPRKCGFKSRAVHVGFVYN